MSQVSYGTITIVDTTDISRIYMVYAKSVSNTAPPSDELTWSESIASAPGEGDFIWQKTVVEKAITEEKTYSDPVCVTGSSGQGVEKIINYYCNYGQGQPEEDYSGWQLEIPEYDGNKPNYWTKVVVIYSDDTRKDFQASGVIATFESERVGILDSLEVSLSPIQDLHGYDKPWVGGAGKNKAHFREITSTINGVTIKSDGGSELTLSGTATGTVNPWTGGQTTTYANMSIGPLPAGTYRMFCQDFPMSANTDRLVAQGRYADGTNVEGISSGGTRITPSTVGGAYPVLVITATDTWKCDVWMNITSGTVTNKTVKIQLEQGSTATSYAPYENICPISGHDEVGVSVVGKNWLPNIKYQEASTRVQVGSTGDYSIILPAGTYKFSASTVAGATAYWQKQGGVIQNFNNNMVLTETSAVNIWFYKSGGLSVDDIDWFQLELGTTATDYEPYQGQTYTADLGQTVYGGTVDVVNGTLTVDRVIVDMGTMAWTMPTQGQFRAVASTIGAKVPTNPREVPNAICSHYEATTQSGTWTDGQFSFLTNGYIYFIDSNYASASDFKTAVSGVQLCYELATPTTYSLTPQEVQTLLGRNNVWSDGTVELRGHTISKRDVMIYKDNGLTDVVNKSAEANTNAAEALEKANDGIVSTTQLWYQTNSTGALSVPASHSQVDQGTVTYNNWRSARPNNNVDSYKYYYYCYEYLHGDGTYTYSAEAILDTSNLSQYQIEALTTKVKNFWWDSNGAHVASGKNGNEVTTNTISTYGYHALMGLTGISFNYDNTKVVDLNSTTPSLDFYQPPVISGSTVTQGKKTMMLSANALRFYNPTDGITEQAVLDTNGLILKKGGVRAGTANQSGFIYLSTDPYGSYSINGSTGISDWKQIIGTKFGVRADGTLYASSVNIQGILTAGAGSTIGPWSITTTSIYKGSATHGTAGNGNMYFGDNGLSISNTFKVSSAGVLNATGAQISGNITANSLIIEEGASIGGLNTDHIDNFQETIDLIDNKIIKNASYIYASDPEDTSTYSETNTQLQYQALKLVSSEESLIWELNPVWASGVADNYITTISGSGGISIRNENEPGSYMELEPHIMNFYDNNSVQASIGNIPDEHIYGIIAEALNAYGSGAGVKFDNAKNNSEDEVRGRFIWVIRDNGHLSLKKY